MTIRKFLSNVWSIHAMVLLGLFALLGCIESNNKYLILFMAISFSGAICGGFVKVIDTINKQ